MNLLVVGPAVLTVLSWLHMWLLASASTARRLVAWSLALVPLLPAQVYYNIESHQQIFLVSNVVTFFLLMRGIRRAFRDWRKNVSGEMTQEWRDLLRAFEIMAKYPIDDNSPIYCEHDVLNVCCDVSKMTSAEKEELVKLGFLIAEDGCDSYVKSYHFGSC